MATRDAVKQQCERIKAHWPSMPATVVALDGYADVLKGYDDAELHAAVSLLLTEYDAATHPKPKHLADYCGRVAKYRRAVFDHVIPTDDGVICTRCGTRTLVEAHDSTRARLQWRLWPLHADTCPVRVAFPEGASDWPPPSEALSA